MTGRLAVTVVLTALAATAAPAAAKSLYSGPGPRPGPDLLYAKPRAAPQLSNRKPFRARPILVSGATAYRKASWPCGSASQAPHSGHGRCRARGAPHTFR